MYINPENLLPKLILGLIGDSDEIVKKANKWDSVILWRWWQNAQATGIAVASGTVPFPYALASTPASMLFTYRKMAHVAWGIGNDLNVPIEPLDDMLQITSNWIGHRKRPSPAGQRTDRTTAPHPAKEAAKFATGILATFTGYAKVTVDAAAKGIPAEEVAIKAIIEKAFPGLSKQFAITMGREGGKQATVRLVPILGGVVSGGMTLAAMTSFSRSANDFYTERRRCLGAAEYQVASSRVVRSSRAVRMITPALRTGEGRDEQATQQKHSLVWWR